MTSTESGGQRRAPQQLTRALVHVRSSLPPPHLYALSGRARSAGGRLIRCVSAEAKWASYLVEDGAGERAVSWVTAPEELERCRAVLQRRERVLVAHDLLTPSEHPYSELQEETIEGGWSALSRPLQGAETLADWLGALEEISRPLRRPFGESALGALYPLLNALKALHQRGTHLGGFSPQQLLWSDGKLRFFTCPPLFESLGLPSLAEPPLMHLSGYTPPERIGGSTAGLDPRSDCFSIGGMLFELCTGHPPFPETSSRLLRHPSPREYQAELSPALVALIEACLARRPELRPRDAGELLWRLERAEKDRARRARGYQSALQLSIGHEIHVGVVKGQYNPTNQDDLFLGYEPSLERGLFLITDGVSSSDYGSGEIASAYLREEAFQSWRELMDRERLADDTLSGEQPTQPHFESAESRLTAILNRANERIGAHISREIPVFTDAPERIMAATAVLGALEGNEITLASLGDSRIYLIRDGWIVSLMSDDDLATHLLRLGQSPEQISQVASAGSLVSCVGDFSKTARGALVPNTLTPQLRRLSLLPGDTLLFCSDGLPNYGGPDEEEAERRFVSTIREALSIELAAFELITLANRGGGGDNLSCILLSFQAEL